jgi:Domain of unknown function (DUF4166)
MRPNEVHSCVVESSDGKPDSSPHRVRGRLFPEDPLAQAHDAIACSRADAPTLGDLRFRALMSDADWCKLPLPIRTRFSKRLAGGGTAVYVGEILETRLSRAGWLLAQLLRLIGAPLPTARDSGVPSVVTVTEDMRTGGQIWTRLYARRRTFPQVIHSSKRFAGRTGLEEYVGYGIGMALAIEVREGALVFRSDGYFLEALKRRFFLPAWISPGALSVSHAEIGDGRFLFTLEIVHPRFGLLIRQSAAFRECQS